jgi:hypothetical protein
MTVILFFLPAVVFFWAFAYFFHNPTIVTEHQAWVSGPLFAVGIAPLFLFFHEESSSRIRKMIVWALGMVAGIGLAAFMYAHLLPERP